MALSALAIQNAKPRDRPYKLSDGEGLHLLIQPNGAKLWRFRYQFGGKEKMLSLGSFPEVSLASARTKKNDARTLVADNIDPSQQRRTDKLAAATASDNTFGAIAQSYIKKLEDEGRSQSTIKKNRWLLEDLAKALTLRPITEIKPAEVLAVLKSVEKQGFRETAHRLRGTIGSVFRFAIANLKAETDPTYALRGALLQPVVQHRPALTDETALGRLMRDIDAYEGRSVVRSALQLVALTLCRPGEARLMMKKEVNWIKKTWVIPAERMKLRREFQIPLSRQALEVLRGVWDTPAELVFPSLYSNRKPLSDNTLNKALRTMGYSGDVHVAHGFRSSASTILNERGFEPDVIEVALSHQDEDEVRRAYNRAQYWPERVQMLQAWADLLDTFRQLKAA